MNQDVKAAIDRVSPNVLVIIVAIAITLMQLASSLWVRQATSAERKIDIENAIVAHKSESIPHAYSVPIKELQDRQDSVLTRLAVIQALQEAQGQRMDRIQQHIERLGK